jgi:hypothetical protein
MKSNDLIGELGKALEEQEKDGDNEHDDQKREIKDELVSPIEIDTSNIVPVLSKSKGIHADKKDEKTKAIPEKIRSSRNSLDTDSSVIQTRPFSLSRSPSSRTPSMLIPNKSPSRGSPTLVKAASSWGLTTPTTTSNRISSPTLVKSPSAWALSTPNPTTTTANMKSPPITKSPPDSRKPSFSSGVKTPPLTSRNASRNSSKNPVKIDKKFEIDKKLEIEKKIKEESKLLQEKLRDEEIAEKMRVMDEKMKKMELAERLYEEKEKVI